MPDLTEIISALNDLTYRVHGYNGLNVRANLLSLNNGVIEKVANADAQLTTEFTYYTKTDAGAELATDLTAIATALTAAYNKYRKYNIGFTAPTGLTLKENGFVLDVEPIRIMNSYVQISKILSFIFGVG